MQKKLSKALKKIEQPSFPIDPFEAVMRSGLIDLKVVKNNHEKRWGINRVIELVDSEFRIKFWKQSERIFDAQVKRDEVRFEKAIQGMKNAYAALDRWAEAHGVQPVPEIKACELQMQDGSVMVVVETQHDAELYQQFRPDVLNRHIWTMQELEVIMESPVIKETMKIKALHPTANLVRLDKDPVKFPHAGETGLDDMKSDELEGEPMNKVFDTSKMVRKASNQALEAF